MENTLKQKFCIHTFLQLIIFFGTNAQISMNADKNCLQNVSSCISLSKKTCLGYTVPFSESYPGLPGDSTTADDALTKLALWSGLHYVPECWDVVQPFLCSLYLPRCDDATSRVELPSKEVCERIKQPCRVIKTFHGSWPDFLDCDRPYFKSGSCGSAVYEKLISNISSSCLRPLIKTENEESWFDEFDGCGIPCQNPLFTQQEHDEVHVFIAIFGSLCIISTLFTLLTFAIDWKNAKRYPALILFFINACFFLGSIGWMAQFAGNARDDIVCRTDHTARRGEPQIGSGQTPSCTIVFLFVYYFMIAGCTWFVMLTMAWFITFKTLGSPRDQLSKKTAYFHIISWCLPLVLSIICLAVAEVDGDSLSGICFIGYRNHGVRAVFVLIPITIILMAGLYFLIKGLITLSNILKNTPENVSEKALSKIRETIIRLGIFAAVSVILVIIMFSIHIYIFVNEDDWEKSFKEYILCKGNATIMNMLPNSSIDNCMIENPPSVVAMVFHILAYFGAGILLSSWTWNGSTWSTWERFLRKLLNKPSNKPVKLKKHKMIARAFEKRKEINNGRMSISFYSTHDDPLGMKFDLNSVSSFSMSSNFANAMPKLVRRRGGLVLPVAGTNRRYSDSDISLRSRRVSIESHHSQTNFQIRIKPEELQHLRQEHKKAKKKRNRRKKKNRKVQPVIAPLASTMFPGGTRRSKLGRRNSDSSVISKASEQGICLSLERQSIEAGSVGSRHSNRSSIETITLPVVLPKQPNLGMFTASSFLNAAAAAAQSNGAVVKGRSNNVRIDMTELKPIHSGPSKKKKNQNHEETAIVNLSYDDDGDSDGSADERTTEVKIY